MRATRRSALLAVLMLGTALTLAAARSDHETKSAPKQEASSKNKAVSFAIFGDWGRTGGHGASTYKPNKYGPDSRNACPKNLKDPFYISIDPKLNPKGPFDKKANDQCVVKACGKLAPGSGDQENCEGKIQQLQAAYVLEQTCKERNCQFVLNTADNFYNNGCNSTNVPGSGPACSSRFKTDWIDVYKTSHTPALKPVTWYSSIGNHDVLGGIQGVQDQTTYTKQNSEWYMPAPYYAKTIGSGATAINLIVAETSTFIDGYLQPMSGYNTVDFEKKYSTEKERAKQLAFLEKALKEATGKPGWTIVMGHHPAFSGDQSYFRDDKTGKPESTAWGKFAALIKKYRPHAYVNGHDHVVCYYNAKEFGYETQFFTSGAGSFTEPNDGGWDPTTGKVRPKQYLKYSNVRMSDGASWTGNIIATASAPTLKLELFSSQTGTQLPGFIVECHKDKRYTAGFYCSFGPGPVPPAYYQS